MFMQANLIKCSRHSKIKDMYVRGRLDKKAFGRGDKRR